jgi:hypothetical protein
MKFIYLVASLFITCSIFSQVNSLSARIQNTGMSILYAGIPIEMQPFGGKNCENIRLVGCEKAEEGGYFYTATASQIGQTVSISVEEKDKKGNYKVVHTTKYLVKPAPSPELMWGDLTDGEVADKLAGSLVVRYDDNVPFTPAKGSFTVTSYSISVSGLKGTLEGTGSEISEIHLEALKNIAKGSKVAIQVKYSGTSSGMLSAMFEL